MTSAFPSATKTSRGHAPFLKIAALLPAIVLTGCHKEDDYSNFSGAVNRIYIEDGSGGTILFTPHGDGPPIKNTYVYKGLDYVFVTIKNGWVEIYVPGHRTKYVAPSQRIIRMDRIIPKPENEILKEEFSKRIEQEELRGGKKE